MGKSLVFGSDEELKALEARLKAGTMKGGDALAYLAKAVPLLRKRSKALAAMTLFVNEVAPEDRLFRSAYGIWRRKEVYKGAPLWVRSNEPEAKVVVTPVDTEAVVAAVVGKPRSPPIW